MIRPYGFVSPVVHVMVCVPDQVSPPFGAVITIVGSVSSNVTEEESSVEVSGVPALPARSLYAMENGIMPSVSPACRTTTASQWFRVGLV